jgi:hypothetical protein
MNTMEIATRLVELCRQGKNAEAVKTLFSDTAVSVEAFASITGPWPHGNRFVVGFQYDVTNKPSGHRMKMDEVGLYTIENGKIVREEFFYAGM